MLRLRAMTSYFGAPNVVRGGSHLGWSQCGEMWTRLCSILASDYLLSGAAARGVRLAADGVAPLERAWSLVSSDPAAIDGACRIAERSLPASGPT